MIGYIYIVLFNINLWVRGIYEIYKNWINMNCKDSILSFLWLIWCIGVRIDYGYYDSKVKVVLLEILMLDDVVWVVMEMMDEYDMLMIVMVDYLYVFNIVGYLKWGNDILG